VAAIHVAGYVVTLVVLGVELGSPTHSTTRVTMYTCYMYCCHNTGIDLRDFKFSVLNNSVTLRRYRPTP